MEGNVLDPYGGAFSTAISAMGSKRSCKSIKKDEVCFSTSFKRFLSLTACLRLDGSSDIAELVSASALGSALERISTMQCENDETDDGERL